MTETRFETTGKSKHSPKIIPIKEHCSTDGSEEVIALYISHVSSWSNKAEFLAELNLDNSDLAHKATDAEHFEKLLDWFNDYSPEETNIKPRYTSHKTVVFDRWDYKAILWEEDERYYVFFWMTTA